MDEISRLDRNLFLRELLAPLRMMGLLVSVWLVYAAIFEPHILPFFFLRPTLPLVLAGYTAISAYNASVLKRFRNPRFKQLWNSCQDRHHRFQEVLGKMRKEKIADLQELPKTISRVSEGLYVALRRADMISDEIMKSEQGLMNSPPVWQASTSDAQSRELYRVADKNIAEYRQQFAGVMAGVQRTEAQSAVFMTTLDTLRIKLLNYRMAGKSPELTSASFLSDLSEAKLQLRAIDEALEELELGPFPKMIAAMPNVPPPMPTTLKEEQHQQQQ